MRGVPNEPGMAAKVFTELATAGVIQEREAVELFTAGVEIDNVRRPWGMQLSTKL